MNKHVSMKLNYFEGADINHRNKQIDRFNPADICIFRSLDCLIVQFYL